MTETEDLEDQQGNILKNKWVIRAITFAIIVAAWQIAGSNLNPIYLSTPTAIVNAYFTLLTQTGRYSLIPATVETLEATFLGFGLSIVIGLPLGLMMGMFRSIDIAIDPYMNALYVSPRVALIPLIIIWFGIGFNAIVVTVLLLAVFPVAINTYAGVRNIGRSLLETSEVFGVKGMRRFRKVLFPSTIPFFMTGLRLGIGQAFIGVIVAQMLLALSGLGYLITAFGDYFDTPQLMALIIELMVLGVAMTTMVQIIENKISYWKQSERAFK